MKMLQLDKLNKALGLHQELVIIYVVDGYDATLYTDDSNRIFLAEGKGETIEETLQDLENKL